MKFILILFVLWGRGLSEPVTVEFDDLKACENAAMDIYTKVHNASQTQDSALVVWGCEPKASR